MFNFKFSVQILIKCEVRIKTFTDMQGLRKFTCGPQFLSKLHEHALHVKEALRGSYEIQ